MSKVIPFYNGPFSQWHMKHMTIEGVDYNCCEQYMMAGKAIVCFHGSAELLSHEFNGLIVQNGNVEEMADSIVTLLQDAELRKRLGENARKTAKEKYDWDILYKQLEDVYAYLLEH